MSRSSAGRALLAAALACGLAAGAQAQDGLEPLEGHILAVSGDHIDIVIDMGGRAIKADDVAVIKRDGSEVGLASVVWVDVGHTKMRVLSKLPGVELKMGDQVVFESKQRAPAPAAPPPPAKAGPATVGPAPEFVPLLAPVNMPKTALTRTANVFHGMVRGWQLYQKTSPRSAWYSASRLDSQGSIERLYAGPWSLVWSANASYRDGSSYSTSDDFRKPRPHLYRLTLSRKLEDGGFLRLGRLFPMELPALGYIDGLQADLPAADGLRFGAVLGARPDRIDQSFSRKEQLASAYATLEKGAPRQLYYTGTLGVLGTLFRGHADELAALLDQRVDLGPKLNLQGSLQLDFDAGAAQVNKAPRLSRANLSANSPVTGWLSLRAGLDHYEPVDIAAERELAGGSNNYLNNGYWRYWTGAAQSLPWAFTLDEDLSFTKGQTGFTPGLWRLSLGRQGLPGLPLAHANVTVYDLYNPMGPDYGSTWAVGLPLFKGRMTIDANASVRDGPTAAERRRLRVSDASLHADWRITQAWLVDLGLSQTYQDGTKVTIMNGGLTYRW